MSESLLPCDRLLRSSQTSSAASSPLRVASPATATGFRFSIGLGAVDDGMCELVLARLLRRREHCRGRHDASRTTTTRCSSRCRRPHELSRSSCRSWMRILPPSYKREQYLEWRARVARLLGAPVPAPASAARSTTAMRRRGRTAVSTAPLAVASAMSAIYQQSKTASVVAQTIASRSNRSGSAVGRP